MNEPPVPLSLFRYAEALVYRAEYPAASFPRILEKLSLDKEAFASAAAHWSAQMGEELARGRPTLLLELARTYGRLEGAIRLQRPTVDAIQPQKEPRALEASRVPPRREMAPLPSRATPPHATPIPAPRGPEGPLVPSYLRQPVETPNVMAASSVAVTPPPPPAPPPPPLHEPSVAVSLSAPSALAATSPLPASAVAAGEALAKARQVARRETAWVDPGEAPPASLPFAKDAPVRAPAPSASREASASPRSARERGTALAPEDFAVGPATPFQEVEVQAADIDFSMFPLERYAEVTVALATGDERSKVLRRFVLTESMWKAMSTAWGERVMNDPSLRAKYAEIVKGLRGRPQE